MDFVRLEIARLEVLEAFSKFELASRPWTPPPPPPQPWGEDSSPTFDVPFRSPARSRSRSRSPKMRSPSLVATVVCVDSDLPPGSRYTPAREGHVWRRHRGFREAYPSPLSKMTPIVRPVPRTGLPNPMYERVGGYLLLVGSIGTSTYGKV